MRSTKLPSWISRLIGVDPRPVPPHVFWLDARRLAYARLPQGPRGVELADYRVKELEGEVIGAGSLGGVVREQGALGKILGELLQGAPGEVSEASLVLPDSWIRIAFAEVGVLPRGAAAREEILRFKLRRLVPFRVEDLRLRYQPVPALADQAEPNRVLMAFGMGAALEQLETVFAGRGVRLGQISNASLSVLDGARASVEGLDLAALVYASGSSYSMLFTTGGQPVIYRYKQAGSKLPQEVRTAQVARDLRLTRRFVGDRLENARLRRVLLSSAPEDEAAWRHHLEEVFEVPVTPLASLPAFAGLSETTAAEQLAPMIGAASRAA